jgi:HAMP domain-containing protein
VTLRTRLTGAFLLFVLVPLLLAGLLLFALLPQRVDGMQGEHLRAGGNLVLASVAERCQRAETVAAAVGTTVAADPARLQQLAEELLADGRVDGLRVLGADGSRLARAGQIPVRPGDGCADGRLVRTGGRAHVVAQQPGRLPSGAGATVLVTLALDDALVARLAEAADAAVVLLDGEQPVAGSATVDGVLLAEAVRQPLTTVHRDGEAAQLVTASNGPGSLGVVVSQRRWYDPTALTWLFPLGVVGSGLLAVGIGAGLARATTSPLEELRRGAARVADGDLTTVIEVRSRDEVGQLAAAFNRMTERCASRSRRSRTAAAAARRCAGSATRSAAPTTSTAPRRRARDRHGGHRRASRRGPAARRRLRRADAVAGATSRRGGVPARCGCPPTSASPAPVGAQRRPCPGAPARRGRGWTPGPGEPSGAPVVAVPLTGSGTVVGVLCSGTATRRRTSPRTTSRRCGPSRPRPPSPSTTSCCTRRRAGCP